MQKKYNEDGIKGAFDYYDRLIASATVSGLILMGVLIGAGALLGFPCLGVLWWSIMSVIVGGFDGVLISAKALGDLQSLQTDPMIPFVNKDVPYGH